MSTEQNSEQFFLNQGLYVVATPIGNFGDITFRAEEILKQCDGIVCEDSRVTSKLLNKLQVKKPLIIYNDHSSEADRQKILELIKQGKALALVSDAGTPLISDPGYKLVNFLLKYEVKITAIPGPCSAIAALSISGLPSDRFLFAGFIPTSAAARNTFFKELIDINTTLIFFESAVRTVSSLKIMLELFGNKMAAIVREITKIHEENRKDNLENLIEYYQKQGIKGEVVILLSNVKNSDSDIDFAAIDSDIKVGLKKFKPKDLANLIADSYHVDKKQIYQRIINLKTNED